MDAHRLYELLVAKRSNTFDELKPDITRYEYDLLEELERFIRNTMREEVND